MLEIPSHPQYLQSSLYLAYAQLYCCLYSSFKSRINIHELTVKTAPTRDESIIVSENTHIKTSVT